MPSLLAEQIGALLPQTQCTQCGYTGCLPYAEALSIGQADINQCPPGGAAGISKLASLLGVNEKPLNPKFGIEHPRKVAFIIEQDCIGCTKCLPPCPVDAILGSSKFMHTIIASECTGCELCIAPCPVDCIIMETIDSPSLWDNAAASHAKQRYQNKQLRLQQQAKDKADRLKKQKEMLARLKTTRNK